MRIGRSSRRNQSSCRSTGSTASWAAPFAPTEVRRILESLEFKVDENRSESRVPSWRATKDISIKDDLVEEIGRMIGYDYITPVAPLSPARVPPANPEREFHHQGARNGRRARVHGGLQLLLHD